MVVRDFLAKMGVDFFATYSPMSSLVTARTVLAIAGYKYSPGIDSLSDTATQSGSYQLRNRL